MDSRIKLKEKTMQIDQPAAAPVDVPRGLAGVVVTDTALGDVRGREGFYHYREYSAVDLAQRRSFEDVWHLMIHGDLPDSAQQAAFAAYTGQLRRLPDGVRAALPAVVAAAWLLRSTGRPAQRALTVRGDEGVPAGVRHRRRPASRGHDGGRGGRAHHAGGPVPARRGLEPVEPRTDLSYSANYLYMLTGSEPSAKQARAIEQYLIATIDHGFNASTFTARVIASTGADVAAALVGAVGALSGPLHGGAPSRALDTLDAIGSPERIDGWIREHVLAGERIMGFGHPVYRTEDPRSRMLRGIAQQFGGPLVDFAIEVEQRVEAILTELKPGRELHTNVEFYAGVVMELCGLPREMFTPTFAAARVVGWSANILEQARDSKIIRPAARYVGPPPPAVVPAAA